MHISRGFAKVDDEEVDMKNDDSDDEVALYRAIDLVTLSPVISPGFNVERYPSGPLLKESDEKIYAEF
jgi:hypothetical protein